jgi:hypothetical protein
VAVFSLYIGHKRGATRSSPWTNGPIDAYIIVGVSDQVEEGERIASMVVSTTGRNTEPQIRKEAHGDREEILEPGETQCSLMREEDGNVNIVNCVRHDAANLRGEQSAKFQHQADKLTASTNAW